MTNELRQKIAAYCAKNPGAGRHAIAKKFGITENQARGILGKLANPAPNKTTLQDDLKRAQADHKLREADEAARRYKKLLGRVAHEQEIVGEFRDAVIGTIDNGFTINIPSPAAANKRPGQPEDAVLVVSDSHVGKLVRPRHTLGFGHYNPRVFLDRLRFMEETVSRLLRENVANPIETLHILFLGDLVEGALNHAEEIPNRWLVADQVLLASLAFYQFVARLSRVVPNVVCRGLGGNHARWMNQKKPPTANRYSNFDFIVLGQIAALLETAGPGNVKFDLDEGAFQVFDIKDWRFKVSHGDHLKGGDQALGTPSHSIGREINATTQRYNARGEKAPDYYLVGDKHRFVGAATATGRYIINGAWFADDEFAMHLNFTPCRPFQLFFGVHPKHGRSWGYELNLDAAKEAPISYDLPARLLEKVEASK